MIAIETSFEILPYKTPVPVRGKNIKENRFLKVRILEQDYYLSTLPGFHSLSLEETAYKLKIFFSTYKLNLEKADLSQKFFNLVAENDAFLESIKEEMLFNVEIILFGILNKARPDLFSHETIKINQLYREKNGVAFYKDSECIKIKITPSNTLSISKIIMELYSLNPKMIYRLDGNRSFEIDEMIQFEENLFNNLPEEAFKNIDYIEEPFKNFFDSFLYEKRSLLKIAIDESFKFYMNKNELNFISVIKPSLLGISPVCFWLRSRQDNRAIISTSFEHPTISVGLDFLARIRPNEFHGLEVFF